MKTLCKNEVTNDNTRYLYSRICNLIHLFCNIIYIFTQISVQTLTFSAFLDEQET